MLPLKPDAVSELMIKKIQITYKRLKEIIVVRDTSRKYLKLLIEIKLDL